MTGGTVDLPPGQELRPRRRWWRHLRYVPLVLLIVASLVALIVGRVAGADIARRTSEPATPAPVTSAEPGSVESMCQPRVEPAAQEPWLTARDASEQQWQSHSADWEKKFVIGPNGWIFWSEYVDKYASQAVGRQLLTQAQVQQWIDHFTAVRDALAAQGVEFMVVITPSTSSIYPEELPTWMQQLRGSTIMDQVINSARGLPIVDLRADLVAQKSRPEHLFSWSNSHWTDFGAYIAWQQIARCTNAMHPDDRAVQVPEISGATVIGDFNEWAPFGVTSRGADWAVPDFTSPMMDVSVTGKDGSVKQVPGKTPTDLSALPVETTVPNSWTGKSALIFRDSMGGGLSPYWQQAYSPTWQMMHPYPAAYTGLPSITAEVAKHKPDVVIVQLAERYLLNAPPQGASY